MYPRLCFVYVYAIPYDVNHVLSDFFFAVTIVLFNHNDMSCSVCFVQLYIFPVTHDF